MDSPSLLTRIIAACLPLIVIALVFGGIGYATKQADQKPVPPLPQEEARVEGARGVVQSASGGQLALTMEDGSTRTYQLSPNATIEVLRATNPASVNVGDWLNGGAVLHAQSLFALTGLVLIPDPVVAP
jgi:hypothetical protein